MTRIELLERISELFDYKLVTDNQNNEYVLLKSSLFDIVDSKIIDKTEFEALETHVHIIDNVKKSEFCQIAGIADSLGNAILSNLKNHYPDKQFRVYVSVKINGSLIVRFHQKWLGEMPYYNPEDFNSSNEKVYLYES